MTKRYCPRCGWTLEWAWPIWYPYCSRTCAERTPDLHTVADIRRAIDDARRVRRAIDDARRAYFFPHDDGGEA